MGFWLYSAVKRPGVVAAAEPLYSPIPVRDVDREEPAGFDAGARLRVDQHGTVNPEVDA